MAGRRTRWRSTACCPISVLLLCLLVGGAVAERRECVQGGALRWREGGRGGDLRPVAHISVLLLCLLVGGAVAERRECVQGGALRWG